MLSVFLCAGTFYVTFDVVVIMRYPNIFFETQNCRFCLILAHSYLLTKQIKNWFIDKFELDCFAMWQAVLLKIKPALPNNELN